MLSSNRVRRGGVFVCNYELSVSRVKYSQSFSVKCNSENNIFLYMTDHGSDGTFLFPNAGDILTNLYFNETLTQMYNDGKYNKMLIYMESCFSGSMFYDILSPDINVLAVTSANQHESSMAAFCRDPEVPACLAGGFSYNWISDSASVSF
ncbi:unnamed protein product [Trichobilharzia regenti]|nr:unnamed protein product [Trichobilharzia regenti]